MTTGKMMQCKISTLDIPEFKALCFLLTWFSHYDFFQCEKLGRGSNACFPMGPGAIPGWAVNLSFQCKDLWFLLEKIGCNMHLYHHASWPTLHVVENEAAHGSREKGVHGFLITFVCMQTPHIFTWIYIFPIKGTQIIESTSSLWSTCMTWSYMYIYPTLPLPPLDPQWILKPNKYLTIAETCLLYDSQEEKSNNFS